MFRYFIEVTYKGTFYAGYQVQENAVTIQSALQEALAIFFKTEIQLTGSSRTDSGVHALQNFFHFDFEHEIPERKIYNLNAILPKDIAIKSITPVNADAHCRFNAVSRLYKYYIYHTKDPFLEDTAYYFPYKIDEDLLRQAAEMVKQYQDFTSFSKRNTQVNNFICKIIQSEWTREKNCLVYTVEANRFLRGMVRGLTGTMLQVGRRKLTLNDFKQVVESKDNTKADFSVPGHGLFLVKVNYPENVWPKL
jgi:tRNA pseudouridine38-40 synthase